MSTVERLQPGFYRNSVGAELHVLDYLEAQERYSVKYLGPGVYLAEARYFSLSTSLYVVSAASLKDCGYEAVES